MTASRVDELCTPIALQVEQRRQVAVVHAGPRRGLHLRLGVQRHAHAGLSQHREVVCPVTHRERVLGRDAEAGEKEVQGAADISARIEEAKKANKNSILLLVAKGGKSAEMRFIALKLK